MNLGLEGGCFWVRVRAAIHGKQHTPHQHVNTLTPPHASDSFQIKTVQVHGLVHAFTKSFTNFSPESLVAYT